MHVALPAKLKHKKTFTRKSSTDRKRRRCIVQFNNVENIKRDMGCFTEYRINNIKVISSWERLTFACTKDKLEYISFKITDTLDFI